MKKFNLEYCHKLASLHNGKCLSEKYINCRNKLQWQCYKNHIWNIEIVNIKRGSWCPICAGTNKHTIKEMNEVANKNGGLCLSEKYINNKSKLKWKCKNNHIWYAIPNDIVRGCWCSICSNANKEIKTKLTLLDMYNLAKSKNGECLSTEYKNIHTKLKWKCIKNHEWEAKPYTIKNGSWCPECSSGRSEKLCREYFNQLFKQKFIKCRPIWLDKLELDGYNKKLKLAFEYNGKQHYIQHSKFHKTEQEFVNQQSRDILKRKLCKLNGVKLITIPYKYNCYNPNKMYKFIDTQI